MSADLDCSLKFGKVVTKEALDIGDALRLPTYAEYATGRVCELSYDRAVSAIKLNHLVARKGRHMLRIAAARVAAANIGNRIPQ